MEFVGLFFEFVFFLLGVGLYLFSRGFFRTKDSAMQQKAEAFRNANGWWMRLTALALIAIMAANIFLHLQSFFS
jgi:hypothetical protein